MRVFTGAVTTAPSVRPAPHLAGPSVNARARLEGARGPQETVPSASAGEQPRNSTAPTVIDLDGDAPDPAEGPPVTDAPSSQRRRVGDNGGESRRGFPCHRAATLHLSRPLFQRTPWQMHSGARALPRLQRTFDDLERPELFRPAALMAMQACPCGPMQQVN